MPIYTLYREQHLGIDLAEAWEFFCDPFNLALITPPWLCFEVVNQPPKPITAGTIIRYRIKPLAGVKLSWTTEITHLQRPRLFVDEQRFGPYRFWHHQHRFEAITGGVKMCDHVHYALYGGLLSAPLHALLVRPKLEAIFDHRRLILENRFPYH